ncbi:hypothetical protein [Pandoravirus japonicus]|uniref:Uncharacterized protein n=1 Tax=Pandoravirus japonicus TaxID=2823154 RepID=A0A811BT67_9VIRU|nr:hypothetical protein [Pandoravirus japonicus]
MLANSGDNKGNDIGSSSLPATRPLCIPVRFQPLGGTSASRWMGTGALAAAASTLPPPLPACDERNSAGGDPFDTGAQVPPPAGNVWACAPADGACGTESTTMTAAAVAPYDGSVQAAGSSRLTDRPWLWPLVVALVLALAILGGGAAWATWQRHRRQRQTVAASAAPASPHPDAIALPSSPALGIPAGSAVPAPPFSPLFQAADPYSAATPVSYVARPMPPATVPEPHQVPLAHTQQQQQQAPMSPFAQAPQRQQPPPHAVAHAAQPQARGTYMMVERPPLRMRNVATASRRHGDSDDDDDQSHDDDDAERGRRAPARPVASGPRGGGGSDAWSQRAFARRPAMSPQESHLDPVRPLVAHQPPRRPGGDQAFPMGGGGVVGRPHEADVTERIHSGHRVGAGNNRGDEASGGADDDGDDSLGDGVADYWADADRARQIYFASPEERAAQVVRLGSQAYSPDGTPMPVRLH